MWYYAEGKERPQTVDSTSSKNWVYVRRNIEEFEREDEKFYRWEEMKIRKEDYSIYQQERANAANLDYIAMMTDIDLDDDEEEW